MQYYVNKAICFDINTLFLDIFSGHFDTLDIPVVEVLSFSSLLCLQSRMVMGMIRSEDDFPLSIPRG